jgi:hypothetical protein
VRTPRGAGGVCARPRPRAPAAARTCAPAAGTRDQTEYPYAANGACPSPAPAPLPAHARRSATIGGPRAHARRSPTSAASLAPARVRPTTTTGSRGFTRTRPAAEGRRCARPHTRTHTREADPPAATDTGRQDASQTAQDALGWTIDRQRLSRHPCTTIGRETANPALRGRTRLHTRPRLHMRSRAGRRARARSRPRAGPRPPARA